MLNLKKMISRYLKMTALFMVVVMLMTTFVLHVYNEHRRAQASAMTAFIQIEQLIEHNQADLAETKEEYQKTCLHNAETIAYIIQSNPSVLGSVEELRKIAEFIEVDEIHIFDKSGCIFTGTHPEYYNYTFDSGEQMAFFKPMLSDKSLELCQEITPNTAEQKLMQYSALWSGDGEFIVQVGMEPVNVLHMTEKNELSYIFSTLRVNAGIGFYAIDEVEGTIVGSTTSDEVGKNLSEIGLNLEQLKTHPSGGFHEKIKGIDSYCVFKKVGTNYIGRIVPNSILYKDIPMEILELAACLVLIATVMVTAVTGYMNKYVVGGIYDINANLRMIAKGDLEKTVDVHISREFSELSSHINEMIKSLLANTEKLSYVLNKVNMNIGVYEYNEHMKKVRITEYIPDILALDKNDERFSDCKLFQEYISEIRRNPVEREVGIYSIVGMREAYVKIEEITQNNDTLGVMIDVTEEVKKRRVLEEERDIDLLTGLYNRRGIENKLNALFQDVQGLGHGAVVMADADGLKIINDQYGHEKGDIYLRKIAEVFELIDKSHCLAARVGGDEFVLILYGYESEAELLDNIDKLKYLQDSNTLQLAEGIQVQLRFSLGYSIIEEGLDYATLLEDADKRMYENKRNRKKMSG